ncbi:MAG TPA: hypothetical protein VGQ00_04490 [Candidatus Norongarragalinales archaeon]|jgi:hypothetical protein|nr:hypothetical protein [Candidatus Norongarragalinales archaeon]
MKDIVEFAQSLARIGVRTAKPVREVDKFTKEATFHVPSQSLTKFADALNQHKRDHNFNNQFTYFLSRNAPSKQTAAAIVRAIGFRAHVHLQVMSDSIPKA